MIGWITTYLLSSMASLAGLLPNHRSRTSGEKRTVSKATIKLSSVHNRNTCSCFNSIMRSVFRLADIGVLANANNSAGCVPLEHQGPPSLPAWTMVPILALTLVKGNFLLVTMGNAARRPENGAPQNQSRRLRAYTVRRPVSVPP